MAKHLELDIYLLLDDGTKLYEHVRREDAGEKIPAVYSFLYKEVVSGFLSLQEQVREPEKAKGQFRLPRELYWYGGAFYVRRAHVKRYSDAEYRLKR